MTKLEELYARRKVFIEYNAAVPSELLKEIESEENKLLENIRDDIFGLLPHEINADAIERVVVRVEYTNGTLSRIGITSKTIDETQSLVADAAPNTSTHAMHEQEHEYEIPDANQGRSRSIGFSVKFADGKIIKFPTAQKTLIETLKYIGLERVSKFRGRTFAGYPLVGKEKRNTATTGCWQKRVEGWWIYVNMSNDTAIDCIKKVAASLNVPLQVMRDEGNSHSSAQIEQTRERQNSSHRLYSLNGGAPVNKSTAVWQAVNNMLDEMPNATFGEILEFFPRNLQGSYGVVRTIEDVRERIRKHGTEARRWFLEPHKILTAGDGVQFAVSNQWGTNFTGFRRHVIQEFGWTLEEI
ncbi:MAG: hypothetical protein NC102_10890 [Clostridium sp.]|nr:hypothetical protein [Clostridium sp.]